MKTLMMDPVLDRADGCEVRAHGQVIRYGWKGHGRPLVLLRSPGAPDPAWRELLRALERCHRVIAPEPPPIDAEERGWLAAFLEGLGCARVRVLACDRFCGAALDLALFDRDSIARLVLVPEGITTRDAIREPLLSRPRESVLAGSRVPLLLAPARRPTPELATRIVRFLAEEARVPVA